MSIVFNCFQLIVWNHLNISGIIWIYFELFRYIMIYLYIYLFWVFLDSSCAFSAAFGEEGQAACWWFRIQQEIQSCLASVPCSCLLRFWCFCAHQQYQHRKTQLAPSRRVRGLFARFHGMVWEVLLGCVGRFWNHMDWGPDSVEYLVFPDFRDAQGMSRIFRQFQGSYMEPLGVHNQNHEPPQTDQNHFSCHLFLLALISIRGSNFVHSETVFIPYNPL